MVVGMLCECQPEVGGAAHLYRYPWTISRQPSSYVIVNVSGADELQTFPTFEFMAYQEAHISEGFCQQ